MLSGLASDITGGADVCECIPKDHFSQEPFMKYVLQDEIAFIYLKSKKEHFIFTDQAVIFVLGNSAASKKRLIDRFDYGEYRLEDVRFETAGASFTDGDCEIKFKLGGREISIDINKKSTDTAIHYYRALVELAKAQERNYHRLVMALNEAKSKQSTLHIHSDKDVPSALAAISSDIIQFTEAIHIRYKPHSYKEVFLRYFH